MAWSFPSQADALGTCMHTPVWLSFWPEMHLHIDGLDNLGTVNAITNLAGFFRDLGQYDESKREFRQALEIEPRFFGPEQAETADTKYDMASLVARKGQIDEALSLLNPRSG